MDEKTDEWMDGKYNYELRDEARNSPLKEGVNRVYEIDAVLTSYMKWALPC